MKKTVKLGDMQQLLNNPAFLAAFASFVSGQPNVSAPKVKLSRKEQYEADVMKGLRRKLGANADIQLRVNVLTYGRAAYTDDKGVHHPATGWIAKGRQVKKGESAIKGVFHISQTEAIAKVPATT